MCVTMTVCACKGGVGKSTTTLNLGAALASAGKRVVVVDNDVQANLTAALGFTPAELHRPDPRECEAVRRCGAAPSNATLAVWRDG